MPTRVTAVDIDGDLIQMTAYHGGSSVTIMIYDEEGYPRYVHMTKSVYAGFVKQCRKVLLEQGVRASRQCDNPEKTLKVEAV